MAVCRSMLPALHKGRTSSQHRAWLKVKDTQETMLTHTQSVHCRCVCVHVCVYSRRYPIKGIFEAVLKHTETQSLVLSIILQATERPVRRLIGRDSKAPHFICTMCVISNKFALLGNYWKATWPESWTTPPWLWPTRGLCETIGVISELNHELFIHRHTRWEQKVLKPFLSHSSKWCKESIRFQSELYPIK